MNQVGDNGDSGVSRSSRTVLVVEDDADIRMLLREILEREGFEVLEAGDGRDGLRRLYASRPDLIILDVAMPGLDGWATLERIRELSDLPVLMLTASVGEMEKVRGLRGGADEYLTKPFGRQELLARIEALLRRVGAGGAVQAEIFADELIRIDFAQRRVTADGNDVELTPTEFKLLTVFTRNPNQVLTQDQLLDLVWGSRHTRSRDQVKLYVSYLRRKLSAAAGIDPVETVRGFGYRYEPRVSARTSG
jgi:DNA-binding response OmpR family regulator